MFRPCHLVPYFKFVNNTNIRSNKRNQVFAELTITQAGLNSQFNPLFAQTCGTIQGTFTLQLDQKSTKKREALIFTSGDAGPRQVLPRFKPNQIWYTIRQLSSHTKGQDYSTTSCRKPRTTWKNSACQI